MLLLICLPYISTSVIRRAFVASFFFQGRFRDCHTKNCFHWSLHWRRLPLRNLADCFKRNKQKFYKTFERKSLFFPVCYLFSYLFNFLAICHPPFSQHALLFMSVFELLYKTNSTMFGTVIKKPSVFNNGQKSDQFSFPPNKIRQ